MPKRIIYLLKTSGCSACACQESINHNIIKDIKDIDYKVCEFPDVPNFLKQTIIFTDFPITVFCEDDTIKYYFTGTKNRKGVISIINNIYYNDLNFDL